jgi:hypothetical protein
VKDAEFLPHRLEGHPDDLFAANNVGRPHRNTDVEGEHLDASLDYVERVDRVGEGRKGATERRHYGPAGLQQVAA